MFYVRVVSCFVFGEYVVGAIPPIVSVLMWVHKEYRVLVCISIATVRPKTEREIYNKQGPDFDDMSSFFPCDIDDATQYWIWRAGSKNSYFVVHCFVILYCF